MLWAGAMFACFFLTALYMQGVLGYDALEVGLAYLPSCVVMALMSLRFSDKLVMRFGIRTPLTVGLGLAAASLALFSQAPVDGSYVVHVLPGMVLLGIGAGIAFNPVLLAAMGDVEPHEAGLASGVVNTSFMMGGALGLAVLVSLSTWRTERPGRVGLRAARGAERRLPAGLRRRCRDGRRCGGHRGTLLRPKPMEVPEPETEETLAAGVTGLIVGHRMSAPLARVRAGLAVSDERDDVTTFWEGRREWVAAAGRAAARPAARPVAVGRSAADRQDRAGRRAGVVGGHRRVPPRPAVPRALVGGAGRARHALPDLLAWRPAGGGHLRRRLPRLGSGSGARARPGGDGRDAAAGVPHRPPPADRRGVHNRGDHRDRGAGHQRGQPGEPAVEPAAGLLRRRRHRPAGQPRRSGRRCATARPGRTRAAAAGAR